MSTLTLGRLARANATAKIPRTAISHARRSMGSSTVTMPKPAAIPSFLKNKRFLKLGAAGVGLGVGQYYLGNGDNIFEHKFVTTKKSEDLADFYGTEDFMEIFCVLPFMFNFLVRGAEFDDDGTVHAWGLLGPGELEISIDFDEREIDTTGDGEPDTIAWFNKKEHFHDFAPAFLGGFTLWEMTQNFGYHRLDDGTCEVYHHGEKFSGFFPVRLLFQLHSQYVIWATEKYVNSDAFGTEDRESDLEEQRQNIPMHVFKQFIENLSAEVEKAKTDQLQDSQKKGELEVTLQRLKTISTNMEEGATLPRLRTLRSRKTNVAHMHLVVDDSETKDAIRTAMQQIGSSKGHRHEPVAEMYELARRTTLSSRKNQERK